MMPEQIQMIYRRFRWTGLALVGVLLLAACGAQAPSGVTPTSTSVAQPTSAPPTTAPSAPTTAPPTATRLLPTQTPTPLAPTAPPATATTQAQVVPPTPACGARLNNTPAQTEGPYYKPNTPERTSLLEPGITGAKLIVTGYVLTADCKPIAHAWLDFWQADDKGEYDNTGYQLRGHLFTDAAGRYSLETIVPGLYPGRTRHIHVKVQAPNQPVLTTQVYFPNESRNQSDTIFDRNLVLNAQDTANGKVATFNFVLNVK